jgi:hypothetical protein
MIATTVFEATSATSEAPFQAKPLTTREWSDPGGGGSAAVEGAGGKPVPTEAVPTQSP